MIAIVDGGSTKCDWLLLDAQQNELLRTHNQGFNPNLAPDEQILASIQGSAELLQIKDQIEMLFYYGSGCALPHNQNRVSELFKTVFSKAFVFVKEDLSAAAYAAYQGQPSLVCILGTGSNACYFDGQETKPLKASLGYLIGDEGSGSAIGKHLLRDYYMQKMPAHVQQAFQQAYPLVLDEVIQSLYQKPATNAYLASFNAFVHQHKHEPYAQQLLYQKFKEFFYYQILGNPYGQHLPIHFVGSIAYVYQDIIRAVAAEYHLNIGQFVQKPIDALADYHFKYILPDMNLDLKSFSKI